MKELGNLENNLKKYWNNSVLWNQYNIESKDYQDRLLTIKDIIPQSLHKVVDIGCGKGEVLRSLKADKKIAIDISETALSLIEDQSIIKISADIGTDLNDEILNLVHNADLLICLEVLEHLPEDKFLKAVKNILTISPKFLLIGVPYKEPLEKRSFRCNNCGKLFNVDTHLRTFNDKKEIVDLFADKYLLVKEAYVGHIYPRIWSTFYTIKNKYIGKPDEFAVCYYCGNNNFPHDKSFLKKFIGRLLLIVERIMSFFVKKYPYWMLLLFQRKEE